MSVRRRPFVLATRILVPVLILGLGVGVYALLSATKPQVARVDHQAAPPERLVFVVQPVPVRRQWRGYGTAEPEIAADVPARVTATVVDVPAEIQEGAAVKAGQLLVRLDPADFERRVEQAQQTLAAIAAQIAQLSAEAAALRDRLPIEEADVRIAERERERVRAVVERGAGNPQDLDTAERTLIAAQRNRWQVTQAIAQLEARRAGLEAQRSAQESALRAAKEDLDRTEITSPIDGVVQSIAVKPGESIRAGEPVARVANLGLIEIPVRLAASARNHVALGDAATLQAPNQPELCWTGRIERVSPNDDAQTRTMTAYVVVDQAAGPQGAAGLLHPGRFVEAAIASAVAEPRWIVPRRAVRAGRVFTVDGDGVVRSVPVSIDFALEGDFAEATRLADDQWAVLADDASIALAPGTRVIVNASATIADGERITPVLAGETASATRSTQGIAQGDAAAAQEATP